MEDSATSEATVVEAPLVLPNIPKDPAQSFDAGDGWESRLKEIGLILAPQQGLHPHPQERDPKGPHFDWHFRKGNRTFGIRNKGNIQV